MATITKRNHIYKSQDFANPFEADFMEVADTPAVGESLTLESFIIEEEIFEYPMLDTVPAGIYGSEIKKMEPRMKGDKKILDVCYEIIDRTGEAYFIKQSYPDGSRPMRDFSRAMIAAGVKAGSTMKAAIGVREVIELAYVSQNSDFGSIIRRIPETATIAYQKAAEMEDDYVDILPQDDE